MRNKRPIFILIPITLLFALSYIVMLLWNMLIPVIFGLKAISYLQAIGLFLLSRILFGNFGFGNRRTPFGNPKCKEKLMSMTPEERQKFKQEWKERFNNKIE